MGGNGFFLLFLAFFMLFFGGAGGGAFFSKRLPTLKTDWAFFPCSPYENGMKTIKFDIYANTRTTRCRFHGAKNKSVFQWRQLRREDQH